MTADRLFRAARFTRASSGMITQFYPKCKPFSAENLHIFRVCFQSREGRKVWRQLRGKLLERICQQGVREAPKKKAEAPKDPEFRRLERMARDVFGTKAELSGDETHGKLIVHYQTADDLQRIWDLLEIMQQGGQ